MISFLRTKLSLSSPLHKAPILTVMDTYGSQRLVALAQQLRFYKPPSLSPDEIEDQNIEESSGKVVPQVGFQESATSIVKDPERFRPNRAAVLICIFEGDAGDFRVILTKRSSKLSTHSGEVSLPGGKADESDKDDFETATREAKEEIGLDPSLVNVVTVLEPFLSKHLLRVIPVIGILTDKKAFKPIPNPAEVEAVFDAPLEMFIKDENRQVEEREWMGEKYLIHFFDYETGNKKYLIWGLTAGILIKAASVVYQRPPAFLEQNPRFKFPKGEVSLPGGKREEGDADDVETALREATEEIGLDPSLVDVVTVFEPFMTKYAMAVVPVVGILFDKKAFNPAPNVNEVETVFDVPLEMFLKDENRREQEKEWMGDKYLLHFFDHQSGSKMYTIWAITASILIRAASLVYQRPPAFQERKPTF